LSKGLKQVSEIERVTPSEIWRVVKRGVVNPNIIFGVTLQAGFFTCLLILLSRSDVSFVWPLTALGFVLATLAAKFFLHEHVSPLRWVGVILIVIGAWIISWTEQHKPQTVPEAPGTACADPQQ
jgi:drug/metabolite transporter (DMT)-like permease